MENARKSCHLANTDTSVRTVKDNTVKPTALEEKLEALEHRGHCP
jgi:hypothetical protein